VTLDGDLTEFLSDVYDRYSATHEIVTIMHGDHGMRYGDWFKDLGAKQEYRLPVFFLMTSSDLLSNIEGSITNLNNNALQLTTKRDMRKTLLYLTYQHVGVENTKDQ
jgi:hypothetical protein